MALGRLSAFRDLDKPREEKPRSVADGQNLTRTAEAGPFAPDPDAVGGVSGTSAGEPGSQTSGVTGLDPGLVSQGLAFASLPAAFGGLTTGLGGLLGGLGGRAGFAATGSPFGGLAGSLAGTYAGSRGQNAAIGAIPSAMTSEQGPVSINYGSGPAGFGSSGRGLSGAIAGMLGSLGVPGFTAPTLTVETPEGFAFQLPTMSPNMGFGIGRPGSTSLGPTGTGTPQGHTAGVPMSMDPTFDPAQHHPFFGPRPNAPDVDIPDATFTSTPPNVPNYPDIDVNFPDVPSGDVPSGGLGEGLGEGAGAVSSDAWHQGGWVGSPGGQGGFEDLEQDNQYPQGATNDRNSPDEATKEVEGTLEQGEFVVNKEAAGRFGPLLNTLNQIGRNKQLRDFLGNIFEGAVQGGFGGLMK